MRIIFCYEDADGKTIRYISPHPFKAFANRRLKVIPITAIILNQFLVSETNSCFSCFVFVRGVSLKSRTVPLLVSGSGVILTSPRTSRTIFRANHGIKSVLVPPSNMEGHNVFKVSEAVAHVATEKKIQSSQARSGHNDELYSTVMSRREAIRYSLTRDLSCRRTE